jgi:signal transduction histidine kinase
VVAPRVAVGALPASTEEVGQPADEDDREDDDWYQAPMQLGAVVHLGDQQRRIHVDPDRCRARAPRHRPWGVSLLLLREYAPGSEQRYIRRVGRRHQLLLDAAVPLLAGGVAVVGVAFHGDGEPRPLVLALALAAAGVLTARRRAPLATLAVSGALVLALLAVDHTAGAAAVVAPAVALYSVGLARGRRHQLAAGLAAVAAVVLADTFLARDDAISWFAMLGHAALVAVPLLAAEAVRSRRSYVALLHERLELAERTREEEAQRRVEQERIRIARDLHDAVAHALTTINVQAGVAAHLLDRAPGNARGALRTIEEASHEALDELRAIVGILREHDGERAPLDPAPTLDGVSELVEQTRALGLDVSLDIRGEPPRRLPEAVQLAAFRIVQESLTNARRHAAGAPARVGLSFEPDRLLVTVENGPSAAAMNGCGGGAGVGIIGMKERAVAVGGALHATPSPDGFRVAAELPYRRAE